MRENIFHKGLTSLTSYKGEKVTFKDVAGVTEAKEEVSELVVEEILGQPHWDASHPRDGYFIKKFL